MENISMQELMDEVIARIKLTNGLDFVAIDTVNQLIDLLRAEGYIAK